MSEHTKNFVDLVANGSSAEAGDAFKDALRNKVASALDNKRVELAGTLFQAQSFSDPKPEVLSPSTETVPPEMKVDEAEPEAVTNVAPDVGVEGGEQN